jgi:hypothetical protein
MELIEKCKEFARLEHDVSLKELYSKLQLVWKQSHPDLFQDDTQRELAEAKFKEIGKLLEKLNGHIEHEELTKGRSKGSDVSVYEDGISVISDKHEIVLLGTKLLHVEKENKRLKDQVAYLREQNKELKNTKSEKRKQKYEEKTKELVTLYNPNESRFSQFFLPISIIALLTFLGNIEEIGIIIGKYFPYSPYYFNSFLFVIFIIVIVNYLLKYWKFSIVKKLIENVKTTSFIQKFSTRINDNLISEFRESQVFEFIKKEFSSKNKFEQLVNPNIDDIVIEELKNIFILNLYNKELINISEPIGLDRKIKVKERHYSYEDDLPF